MIKNTSDKFEIVKKLAGHWEATMPKKPRKKGGGPEWREWDGLTSLLQEFSKFVPEYQSLLGKVPPAVNPGFLRNQGPERLMEGFSVISRACEQRRGSVTKDSMATYLAQAEDVLESYCERWIPHIFEKDRYEKLDAPVVYFDKLFGITRALYLPQIPIISIPLTDYSQSDRWQALAHEFGHHIYWNALKNVQDVDDVHKKLLLAIQQKVSKDFSWVWENWLEEVFADICGTLFAGPSYAVSCQDLAAEQAKSPDGFIFDDGEHPSLFIRPLIAIRVLEETIGGTADGNLKSLMDAIAERWNIFSNPLASRLTEKEARKKFETLGAEVPMVVSTILYEPCWPGDKKLLDLVEFYAKSPLTDQETLALVELKSSIEPIQLDHISDGGRVPSPLDADVPNNLKDLWGFIKTKLVGRSGKATNDPLDEWTALLELGLEEGHNHFFSHSSLRRHTPWGRWHRHTEGNQTIFG